MKSYLRTGARLLPFLVALAGCAQPRYEAAPPASRNGGEQRLVAGRFASSGLLVSYQWETMPTEESEGSFLFRTYAPDPRDAFPELRDPAGTVAVELWMPDMNHGSSPVLVERLGTGTYRASQVFFSMRGAWEIRVQEKVGPNVVDQAALPFLF